MAKVGFVGIGAMGEAMAGHVLARDRDQVFVFDVRKEASAPLAAKGAKVVADLAEMSRCAEIIIVMVVNDAQVIEVSRALSAGGRQGVLVAIAATVRPTTMLDVEKIVGAAGMRVIDAPVCWGLHGAREGKLASLCGGAAEDVEKARPVLEAYSRSVHHIGPLGKGQLAKAINNMLHWAHNVTNYEALLLAKRHGLCARFCSNVPRATERSSIGTKRSSPGRRRTWRSCKSSRDKVIWCCHSSARSTSSSGCLRPRPSKTSFTVSPRPISGERSARWKNPTSAGPTNVPKPQDDDGLYLGSLPERRCLAKVVGTALVGLR